MGLAFSQRAARGPVCLAGLAPGPAVGPPARRMVGRPVARHGAFQRHHCRRSHSNRPQRRALCFLGRTGALDCRAVHGSPHLRPRSGRRCGGRRRRLDQVASWIVGRGRFRPVGLARRAFPHVGTRDHPSSPGACSGGGIGCGCALERVYSLRLSRRSRLRGRLQRTSPARSPGGASGASVFSLHQPGRPLGVDRNFAVTGGRRGRLAATQHPVDGGAGGHPVGLWHLHLRRNQNGGFYVCLSGSVGLDHW